MFKIRCVVPEADPPLAEKLRILRKHIKIRWRKRRNL